MPLYVYNCSKCNEQWDDVYKIAERSTPESLPCPKCGGIDCVKQGITAPSISYTMEASNKLKKLNNSAFAEKLNQIHQNTPGSRLNSASTIVDVK